MGVTGNWPSQERLWSYSGRVHVHFEDLVLSVGNVSQRRRQLYHQNNETSSQMEDLDGKGTYQIYQEADSWQEQRRTCTGNERVDRSLLHCYLILKEVQST